MDCIAQRHKDGLALKLACRTIQSMYTAGQKLVLPISICLWDTIQPEISLTSQLSAADFTTMMRQMCPCKTSCAIVQLISILQMVHTF